MFSVRISDYSYGTHRLHVASNATWDRALYFATAPPFLYTRPSASSNAPRRRPAPSETNDFVLDFTITYPTKIRSSRMPLGVRFRRMCGRLRRKKKNQTPPPLAKKAPIAAKTMTALNCDHLDLDPLTIAVASAGASCTICFRVSWLIKIEREKGALAKCLIILGIQLMLYWLREALQREDPMTRHFFPSSASVASFLQCAATGKTNYLHSSNRLNKSKNLTIS